MFKFLHAADIHLDSPLKGLERYEGAPGDAIRQASRRTLEKLVNLAIAEQVAFVLIAGDLYDGDWRDFNTGLFFVSQVSRLRQAGIPVYVIAGNHDAANKMTRQDRLPENVTLFPSEAPATHVIDDIGVAIHGQSFATRAVTEDLSRGYPAPIRGLFNIGMLHTSATGREGHDHYAPCTPDGLRAKNYDYWALGHVHAHEVLASDPYIIFPGAIQGRHIRENGPKGCCLCTVDDRGQVAPRFEALDVFRWERAVIDVSTCETLRDLLDMVGEQCVQSRAQAADRPLGIRLELTGATPLHQELAADRQRWTYEIRSLAVDIGDDDIWVEQIRLRTRALKTVVARNEDVPGDPLSELSAILAEWREQPGHERSSIVDLEDVLGRLPPEVAEAVAMDDPDWWAGVVDEAGARLASHLSRTTG